MTPPLLTAVALGAGIGLAVIGLLASLSVGLNLNSVVGTLASGLLLAAYAYLTVATSGAVLSTLAPGQTLRLVQSAEGAPSTIVDVIIAFDSPNDLEGAAFSLAAAARLRYPKDRLRLHVAAASKAANSSPLLAELVQTYGASWMAFPSCRLDQALDHAVSRTAGGLVLILRPGEAPICDVLERVSASFAADPTLGFVELNPFLIDGDGAKADIAQARRLPADAGPLARAMLRGGTAPSLTARPTALWRRGALMSAGGIARGRKDGEAFARITAQARGWSRQICPFPAIAAFTPRSVADTVALMTARRVGALDSLIASGNAGFRLADMALTLRSLAQILSIFTPIALAMVFASASFATLAGVSAWGGTSPMVGAAALIGMLALLALQAAAASGWRHSAAALCMDSAATFKMADAVWALLAGGRLRLNPMTAWLAFNLAALCLAAAGLGIARIIATPDLFAVTGAQTAIAAIGAFLSFCALGAVREPRQKRAAPRLPSNLEAELVVGGVTIPGHIRDISVQGARFEADASGALGIVAVGGLIKLQGPDGPIQLPVQLSRVRDAAGGVSFGLQFTGRQLIAFAHAVTLAYQSQERFAAARDARGLAPNSILTALRALGNGVKGALRSETLPARST
ncbi:MAG TPA: hypothetical protein DCL54_00515 [Alphaproteobacteria bacterium]|nr:hypothetical protein [Alphaproteobacteria bacterium]HAJ45049.1 hypothetical protein [Alphaproteobacteria bacterium]